MMMTDGRPNIIMSACPCTKTCEERRCVCVFLCDREYGDGFNILYIVDYIAM